MPREELQSYKNRTQKGGENPAPLLLGGGGGHHLSTRILNHHVSSWLCYPQALPNASRTANIMRLSLLFSPRPGVPFSRGWDSGFLDWF